MTPGLSKRKRAVATRLLALAGALLSGLPLLLALQDGACGGAVSDPTPASACGDSVVDAGEECDDGNASNTDACLTHCLRPVTWIPSDPHVHSHGCGASETPETLAARLRARSLRVGAALIFGSGHGASAPYFTGRDYPLAGSDVLLHFDLEISEFPAQRTGHLVLLGLDSIEFSDSVFLMPKSGLPIVEWARRQPRAIVGLAHGQVWPADGTFPWPEDQCCVPWDFGTHVARGRLDFLLMEEPLSQGHPTSQGWFLLWKSALNAGFRLPIVAGSDWPCIAHDFSETTPRTDVIVEGTLTYEAWLQAIKAGRTAAAIGVGNRLNLRVDRRRLGEELRLAAPREVTVTIESVEPVAAQVELLVNGASVKQVPVGAGAQVVETKLLVERSSWIAALSPHVLTSPVYVLVGERPVRASAADTCYLLRSVEHMRSVVDENVIQLHEDKDEALAAYAEAIAELRRRFAESGGGTCD
jgi:cysteine-rich repeat protein